jgi:hypothetical protein
MNDCTLLNYNNCHTHEISILLKYLPGKYSSSIQILIFKELFQPLLIGVTKILEILGKRNRHRRDILPVNIGPESAIGIFPGIGDILAPHRIIAWLWVSGRHSLAFLGIYPLVSRFLGCYLGNEREGISLKNIWGSE